MGQRQYEYEDLNSLDDESLATVLSNCPYSLLALVMKATPETMRERMLELLGGDKKRLVLDEFQQLDFGKLDVPRDSIITEVEAGQRSIIRTARVLLDDGQIQVQDNNPVFKARLTI
jgi:flagellar motor switch protein FliG